MSVKHLMAHYEDVCAQYHELNETIRELEEAVSENVVSQEMLDEAVKTFKPIKDNYLRLSTDIYLLNMPNKKDKIPAYKRRMQKFMKDIPTPQDIHDENDASLQDFKNSIDKLKS